MGASVSNAAIETYEDTVRYLAQQGITRLEPWVQSKTKKSESHNWDRLGPMEAELKNGRLVNTPEQDYPWSSRKSIPAVYHTADTVEPEEINAMLIDPVSSLAKAQGMAMRRAKDSEIIRAATGDSRDGQGNTVTFDVNQNIGDGTASINFDIITEVTEKFADNDIEPDEPKCMVVSPRQARKILQLTEATSGDYNAMKPLTSKGYVESWMGYSWITSTRLPDASAGQDGSEEYCFAMTRAAIGLQLKSDIWARVAEDPTKSFVWRVYCAGDWGAIRVEDEQLVRLHLSTSI